MFRTDAGEDALEREVARSKNVKLTHEPGTTFQYSNRNYTTLGLLIKVVSGQSYEDYVQAHVLQPLGMQQSFTHLDDAKNHGLATGHQYWFNRPVPGGGLLENRATTQPGFSQPVSRTCPRGSSSTSTTVSITAPGCSPPRGSTNCTLAWRR